MKKIGVIIPAAGLATRMRPLTNATSKAMIAVNGKPILEYILSDLLSREAINEIVVVAGALDDIQHYLENNYSELLDNGKIKITTQKIMNGPLGAIDVGARQLTNDNDEIVVWLGDTLCEDFDDTKSDYLMVSPVTDQEKWCLVDHDNKFYDKPKFDEKIPTELALIGIYAFGNAKAFRIALINGMGRNITGGEHQIADLLNVYIHDLLHKFELLETDKWYDCGNLKNYYESKARLLSKSSRSFNIMTVDTFYGTVTKSSNNIKGSQKIEREKNWFLELEDKQRLFVPQIFDSSYGELVMSWESGLPLNELFIYENVSISNKIDIMDRVVDIYTKVFYKHESDNFIINANEDMFQAKNIERLARYKENYDLWPEDIEKMTCFIDDTYDMIETEEYTSFIHGDLHSGNILFDPFNGKIKFIDPRGHWGPHDTNFGDARYDLGKLMHDFYVGYSYLLAGQYDIIDGQVNIKWNEEEQNKLFNSILDKIAETFRVDRRVLMRLGIIFVATCLPFHDDDPKFQKACWLRAINLMEKMNESIYTV